MALHFLGFVASGKEHTVCAVVREGTPDEGKRVEFLPLAEMNGLWLRAPSVAKRALGLYDEAVANLRRPGVKDTGGAEPGWESLAVFTP